MSKANGNTTKRAWTTFRNVEHLFRKNREGQVFGQGHGSGVHGIALEL